MMTRDGQWHSYCAARGNNYWSGARWTKRNVFAKTVFIDRERASGGGVQVSERLVPE